MKQGFFLYGIYIFRNKFSVHQTVQDTAYIFPDKTLTGFSFLYMATVIAQIAPDFAVFFFLVKICFFHFINNTIVFFIFLPLFYIPANVYLIPEKIFPGIIFCTQPFRNIFHDFCNILIIMGAPEGIVSGSFIVFAVLFSRQKGILPLCMLDVPFYDRRKKTQKPLQVAVSEVKSRKMENPECILCGTCIDNCKQGVIKYSFSRRE